MRIRWFFLLCMSAIFAVMAIAAVTNLSAAWQSYDSARRTRFEVKVVSQLLELPLKVAAERVIVTNIVTGRLAFGDTESRQLADARGSTEQAFAAALAAIGAARPRQAEVVREALGGLQGWRSGVDALLHAAPADRDMGRFGALASDLFRILAQVESLPDAGDTDALRSNATAGNALALARLGWTLRVSAAPMATTLLTAIGSARPLTQADLETIASVDGALRTDWEAIDGYTYRIGLPSLTEAVGAARQRFDGFAPLYRA